MSSSLMSRSVIDLSRRIGSIFLGPISNIHVQCHSRPVAKPILPLLDLDTLQQEQKGLTQRSFLDGKSEMLSLTASFWANAILPKVEIVDPQKKKPIGRECFDESIIQPEPGLSIISPLIEPNPAVIIEKHAHRLLRIKKKKMKVHRRKRRWKKNWARWRKQFLRKEVQRETALRQKLQAKVNEAQKFDARKYVDDYLEDFKYEFIPKTYKGQRLPQFLIKDLLEKEKKVDRRERMNQTNLLTGQPLVLPNETVEDFLKRNNIKK